MPAVAVDIRKDWPPAWRALIEAFGGTQALADALGTTPMTLGRWADKTSEPSDATQKWVNLVAAQKGCKPPFR